MRFRVLTVFGPDGLVQLTEDKALERVGLQPDGAFAELGHQLAGTGEQQIAGENRHVVAEHGVGARDPAPAVGVVHDVVVVQRGEVGNFDRLSGGDDFFGVPGQASRP